MSKILEFFGLRQMRYPRLRFDFLGEGISYSLPDRKLYICWTRHDGQRIYTESFDKWDNKVELTTTEKGDVFFQVVSFARRELKEKIIIVINSDFDEKFWQEQCERVKDSLASIEYTSEKEKDDLL